MFHIRIRYGVIVFNLKEEDPNLFFKRRNKYMLQGGPCVLYFIDFGISD